MTGKDPKDMTASELLRWATNGEPYNGVDGNRWTYPTEKIKALVEDVTGEWPSDHKAFSIIADKIDAELVQARKEAVNESKKPMWWFRSAIEHGEDWPEPRDGEKFRDYLHRCFLPRPRFEDGEPVQFGDDTDELHGVEKFIFTLSGGGNCQMQDADGNMLTVFPGGFVKRPAPDALGDDGLPIKAGETVYPIDSEWLDTPLEVLSVESPSVKVSLPSGKGWTMFRADRLTHTPPDTQERIDRDAALPAREYYARYIGNDVAEKGAVEVHAAVTAHLLKRQRELDAKGAI